MTDDTAPTATETAPTVVTAPSIDLNDCTLSENGFTDGIFNGSPACIKEDKLHVCLKNFADKSFCDAVLTRFDKDKDHLLTLSDVKNAVEFTCNGLVSAKGIEYFTWLEELTLSGGTLTTLDLSLHTELNELICMTNGLETLVIGSTKLEVLDCQRNNLTELDLSDKLRLRELNCEHNPLKTLDIPSTELRSLFCRLTMLESLDVSHMINLEELDCSENQLTTLDVNNLTKLEILFCFSNKLTELHIDRIDQLVELICDSNMLTELNIRNHTRLRFLSCVNNQLSELDLSNKANLVQLCCNNNRITELDLLDLSRLEVLKCGNNLLTSVDLTNLSSLRARDIGPQVAPTPAIVTPAADGKGYLVDIGSIVGYENIGFVLEVYNYIDTTSENVLYDRETGIATISEIGSAFHIVTYPISSNPGYTYDFYSIAVELRKN